MSGMMRLIDLLWKYERNIVSDGYDEALALLSQEIPMTIHRYPTGEPCWTWTVPEKWSWQEAYLETMDGRRIIDARDHPLHIVSYSLPFEGIVDREELMSHLYTHKSIPDAIPFVFKYYDRDWGLCLPGTIKNTLADEQYRVVIHTKFEPGELKVGEVIIQGQSEKTFMLAAHLCHPYMVNDDLTGVVVGVEVMKELMTLPKPYYTYRFLILPETIGAVAYLSHHEELIPGMHAGLFLEMLGNDQPLVLQHSFQKESQSDKTLMSALRGFDEYVLEGEYRRVIDNDERQFNSPGVRVPMLSLSRVYPDKGSLMWPFFGYHSSFDNPSIVNERQLDSAKKAAVQMILAWERNHFVVNNFKGEVFCSGHGIWIDHHTNPEGHRKLFEIMDRCDGERTVADIAEELSTSFMAVWDVISQLNEKKLVRLSRTKKPTTPQR